MTTQTASQATREQEKDATALVRRYQGHFAELLPTHIRAEQWTRIATGLLRRDQKLALVASRNPASLFNALLKCAALGLEPGETFHLVPFGSEIQGITDYTGIIELIYRAGAASAVKVEIVYKNDLRADPDDEHPDFPNGRPRFLWQPSTMDKPWHNPDWFGDRGEMVGVYAYAEMVGGGVSQVVLMTKADVEAVRNVSKAWRKSDSPWQNWPDRMWKKSAVRQLAKWVPTSAEYRRDKLRDATLVEAERVDKLAAVQLPAAPMEIVDGEDAIDGDVVTPAELEAAARPGAPGITDGQQKKMHALLHKVEVADEHRHGDLSLILRREITSADDLTRDEAVTVIDLLERCAADKTNPAAAYDMALSVLREDQEAQS